MKLNKKRLWNIINPAQEGEKLSHYFDIFILTLIALNIIALFLGTIGKIENKYKEILDIFELISIIIFTIEYLTRVWLCTQNYKYQKPIKGRLKFIFTFYALIDLAAILPFYLPFVSYHLIVLRSFRFFRVFRILKVERYLHALRTIKKVFKRKKAELIIFVEILIILLVISSLVIYTAENPVQPKVFTSGFVGLWWSIATITNISINIYAVTSLEKIIASTISIIGILMIALLTSILSFGFAEIVLQKIQTQLKEE